jgi:hypothetical protein
MNDNSKKKKWTIMIYLAGDNNLSDEMIWALKELLRIGVGSNCHVAAQFDPSATYTGPRLYSFDKLEELASTSCDVDGILELKFLREALVEDPSEENWNPENSANPAVLGGFLIWAMNNMKAEHYMLILSGHGSGAAGGLLEDQNPYGRLTIPSLGRALSMAKHSLNGNKIDILGLDSCTMSMVEVAHEVRDSVEFLVGAEGFVQNAGWPYHRLLESLRHGPEPPDLAAEIVDNYFQYYSDYLAADVSTDQAVIHVGAEAWEDSLLRNIRKLSKSLVSELDRGNDEIVRNALVLAHWEAQSFNTEQNVDLYDFCERLLHYLPPDAYKNIRSYCESMIRDWDSIVPLSTHSGPAYQFARGLSIYFPWSEIALGYRNLAFAKDTEWDEFLKKYVDKTYRKLRDDEHREQAGEVPLSIRQSCDGAYVGVGGYPAYRAGGWHSAKAGGWHSAKAGGWHSAKAGGWNSAKAGGWNSAKAGGWHSAKFGSLSPEELVQLCCMKNFPGHFYPPKAPSLPTFKKMIVRKNAATLGYGIRSSPDSTLQSVIRRLPKPKRECIAIAVAAPGKRKNQR